LTLTPAGAEVLTVELKTNLLAPARSGTIRARGEVLKTSRTLSICRGDAFEVAGDTTTHVATMLATMIAREEEPSAAASA
jgi:acyl-coenzyme A thioesterase PaaI-like protein